MSKQNVIALEELKDGRIMDEIQNAARQVIADIKDENKVKHLPGSRRVFLYGGIKNDTERHSHH